MVDLKEILFVIVVGERIAMDCCGYSSSLSYPQPLYRFPSLLASKGCRILERRPMISKLVLNMTKQLPNLIAYAVL
jgi:hypothetical protein